MKNQFSSNYIKYRPDIDGLRAVSVLIVVLFHSGVGFFGGGFIGVDVFFVISGFLITQDILNRLQSGKFSLIEFYMRRARRIFPALFAVLIASVLAALLILPPQELVNFSKSVAASVLSLSNILFYRHAGYFAPAAELEPLLHTWSLGVEEQFYIFWPLILMLLFRFAGRRHLSWVLICILVLSLGYAELSLYSDPRFAFFMLPTRAWELAMGALIAVSIAQNDLKLSPLFASLLSASGLLAILLAGALYTEHTLFPGLSALLPCLGAVAVIIGGCHPGTLTARLLSTKPAVYIGLISYPLYLVHWPLLVFWRILAPGEEGPITLCLLILTMVGLSWLVFRFIETPIRKLPAKTDLVIPWITGVGLSGATFGAIVAVTMLQSGFPGRGHPSAEWQAIAQQDSRRLQFSPCLSRGPELPFDASCRVGNPGVEATAILWGDSHAMQLASAFLKAAQERGMAALVLTKAGCPPIPNVDFFPPTERNRTCKAFNESALKRIGEIPNLQSLIVATRWDTLIDGSVLMTRSLEDTDLSVEQNFQLMERGLREIRSRVAGARGVKPVFVGVAPIGSGTSYSCAVQANFRGIDPNTCMEGARGRALAFQSALTNILPTDVGFLDYLPVLCPSEETCSAFGDDFSLLQDNEHLSTKAVWKLIPTLSRILTN